MGDGGAPKDGRVSVERAAAAPTGSALVLLGRVGRSYAFGYGNVHPTGLPVRKDDVATSLVDALVINEDLRDCLADKKLRQRFWYQRFADLILDRVWKELEDGHHPASADSV